MTLSFYQELDELKATLTSEANKIDANEFKLDELRNDLTELNRIIETNQNSTKKNLYLYQNKINYLHKLIESYECNEPLMEFQESKIKIDGNLIGELNSLNKDYSKQIIQRIKENQFERLDVIKSPLDLCVLPNGNLLLANFDSSNLLVYDQNMKHVKTVDTINNKKIRSFRSICL